MASIYINNLRSILLADMETPAIVLLKQVQKGAMIFATRCIDYKRQINCTEHSSKLLDIFSRPPGSMSKIVHLQQAELDSGISTLRDYQDSGIDSLRTLD